MVVPKANVAQKSSMAKKTAMAVQKVESKMHNRPLFVSLILLNAVLFTAVLVFNYLAAHPKMSGGLFHYGQAQVSRMYPVRTTPAGWAFSIWGVIYLLQGAWILYDLALLCRTSPDGEPAYVSPPVISPFTLVFFMLSSLFNIGWLFLWDRFMFVAGFIFLACIALCLYLTWSNLAKLIKIYSNYLIDQGRKKEVKFLSYAAVNGLSMYASWTTIATLINLNVILAYRSNGFFSHESAAIVALGILSAVIVIYVCVDLTVLNRLNRYVFAPYFVVVWASAAILANRYHPDEASTIMTGIILISSSTATLVKILLAGVRSRNEMYQYRQMKTGTADHM